MLANEINYWLKEHPNYIPVNISYESHKAMILYQIKEAKND